MSATWGSRIQSPAAPALHHERSPALSLWSQQKAEAPQWNVPNAFFGRLFHGANLCRSRTRCMRGGGSALGQPTIERGCLSKCSPCGLPATERGAVQPGLSAPTASASPAATRQSWGPRTPWRRRCCCAAVAGGSALDNSAPSSGSGNDSGNDSGGSILSPTPIKHSSSTGGPSKPTAEQSPAAETSTAESAATATASAAVAMSAATAAVVGAVAAVAPAPPPRTSIPRLLWRAVKLLRSHFLAVLMLYAAKDAAAFLVHRVTQRLTNHVAEVLLGTPTSTAGNPWWLYLDAAFIRANPGYEVLVAFFFLACLPLTIALNSIAFTAAALVCTPPEQRRELAARAAATTGTTLSALQSSVGSEGGAGSSERSGGGLGTSAGASGRGRKGRPGAGSALHLPDDDPGAAALADLGIHALPASPPPPLSPPRSPSEGPPLGASPSTIAAAASMGAPGDLAAPATPGAAGGVEAGGAAAAAGGSGGKEDEQGVLVEESGGPLDALRAAAQSIAAVLPDTARALRRVWWVDLQFNLRALPLQGLSLLVLPALWTVPRLLRIQLALPAAVLERREGVDALGRSSGLMAQSLGAYGLPFAALLGLGRALEYTQGLALALIPPRWWREVVEVPLLIAGLFLLVKAAVHRLQDLLPLATYLELAEQETEAARRLVQMQPESEPEPAGPSQAQGKNQDQSQSQSQGRGQGRSKGGSDRVEGPATDLPDLPGVTVRT